MKNLQIFIFDLAQLLNGIFKNKFKCLNNQFVVYNRFEFLIHASKLHVFWHKRVRTIVYNLHNNHLHMARSVKMLNILSSFKPSHAK